VFVSVSSWVELYHRFRECQPHFSCLPSRVCWPQNPWSQQPWPALRPRWRPRWRGLSVCFGVTQSCDRNNLKQPRGHLDIAMWGCAPYSRVPKGLYGKSGFNRMAQGTGPCGRDERRLSRQAPLPTTWPKRNLTAILQQHGLN